MRTTRQSWCLQMQRRILRNVERTENGCWLWLGKRNNGGYPVMNVRVPGVGHRGLLAHRVAWEAFRFRRFPRDREAAHHYRCVSNHCVNFAHVRATSHSSNMRDMAKKKRWHEQRRKIDVPPPKRAHTIFHKRGFRT